MNIKYISLVDCFADHDVMYNNIIGRYITTRHFSGRIKHPLLSYSQFDSEGTGEENK
jgi:hypothetical protein